MINEIQSKIKFQNIVQCPFNIYTEPHYAERQYSKDVS